MYRLFNFEIMEVIVIEKNNAEVNEILPSEDLIWSARYIRVPRDIIQEYNDQRLVIVYIFFAIKAGMDNQVDFTINHLVSWCGYTPNSHKGKINEKFIGSIKTLHDIGYITLDCFVYDNLYNVDSNLMITTVFNYDFIDVRLSEINSRKNNNEKDGLFAMLYVDEVKMILKNKLPSGNVRLNMAALMLTFAYLRSMIYLKNDTFSVDSSECYYSYYCDIAERLHITVRCFSNLVKILYKDLGLIYYRHIRQNVNDEWVTLPTIFCNIYRRDGIKILRQGNDYYLDEVKRQMESMGLQFDKKKLTKQQAKESKVTKYEENENENLWKEYIKD